MRLPPAILAVVCTKICHHAEGVTCVFWPICKRRIGHSLKLQPRHFRARARHLNRACARAAGAARGNRGARQ
jgi:hypothetical protein